MLERQTLVVVWGYTGAIILDFDRVEALVLKSYLWFETAGSVLPRYVLRSHPRPERGAVLTDGRSSSIDAVLDELFCN